MEFKIQAYKAPEEIRWNYEEIKNELTERVSRYETLVYTEDQIKDAKADRAQLNKLKKALNDERIRLQKEYMAPFDGFKAQVDEIIRLIDKPATLIDRQVKEYEEQKKTEKRAKIMEMLDAVALPYEISLRPIYDTRWMNASISLQTIQKEIERAKEEAERDLQVLEGLTEYKEQAISAFSDALDLGAALQTVENIKRQKEREEKIRAELAERAAREAEKKAEQIELPKVEIEPEAPKAEAPAGKWVRFEVFLDIEKARALREFFESAGIEYHRI